MGLETNQTEKTSEPFQKSLTKTQTKLSSYLEDIVKMVGHTVMWVSALLIAAILIQVTLRYLFNINFPKLDEIQWHFYAVLTMIGISYAYVTDSHVRVDILQSALSDRSKQIIEVLGCLFLLLPFLVLMIDQGFDYFYNSYRIFERSNSPTGLPGRWILKAIIPLSFILLALATLARLINLITALLQTEESKHKTKGIRNLSLTLFIILSLGFSLTFLGESTEDKLVIAMFTCFIALLFTGFPVAWNLAGVGIAFCGIAYLFDNELMNWTGLESTLTGLDYLTLGTIVNRTYSTMTNAVLVALPMFIFMGLMLDQSGVAERLMNSMQKLFGKVSGGLAISVTLIGIILAASTGIIGASVVLLGVLALPTMMRQNYSPSLAAGVVSSAGTLGILIPPSIMLVIMADQMGVPVGDVFMAAFLPGLILGVLYLTYIFIVTQFNKKLAPIPADAETPDWPMIKELLIAILPALLLILSVLGSIFAGLATPTEASGVGAMGAILLALFYKKLTLPKFQNVLKSTLNTTAYIFAIFLGATVFSFVLRELGGDQLIENMIHSTGLSAYGTIAFILFIVFLLGFVLDWIEITLIVLPLMRPIISALTLDVPGFGLDDPQIIWFVILTAVTLQTSFLTPPVGFALFYLKGVCPREITLSHIYKGIIPFVILQLIGLIIIFLFPELTTWLPAIAYDPKN